MTGPLGRRLGGVMSWRSVRSAAGGGVPLDARLGLNRGPRWTSAENGRCSCWPAAACCMSGWAVVCPVHEASLPGSRASRLLSWCSLAELPSRCVVDSYCFPNELPVAGRMASLYRSLLVSLLCHWSVDRADGRGLEKVVPLPGGRFLCLEVDREGGSVRVVIKLVLSWSLCGLVYG